MITEQELNQRLTRVEQELSVVKQQLDALLTPQPRWGSQLIKRQRTQR